MSVLAAMVDVLTHVQIQQAALGALAILGLVCLVTKGPVQVLY